MSQRMVSYLIGDVLSVPFGIILSLPVSAYGNIRIARHDMQAADFTNKGTAAGHCLAGMIGAVIDASLWEIFPVVYARRRCPDMGILTEARAKQGGFLRRKHFLRHG